MSAEPAQTKPASPENLEHTPLHKLHLELGARMVPFAGYSMPVQYPAGVKAEHEHTRAAASLFDVSHMGQATLAAPGHDLAARALEALTPGNIMGLAPGRVRYTVLLNDQGGIIDDLMVTRPVSPADDGKLLLIVNAARKSADYRVIRAALPAEIELLPDDKAALLALQGPKAGQALAHLGAGVRDLGFMTAAPGVIAGIECTIGRSGYTGEDGFEISVAGDKAEELARALLAEREVAPAGLGARDSLRLEAGLCLYGNDIDETTSPVEAGLGFVIAKRRRGEANFPGAARILSELESGPERLLVGIRPTGAAPARAGTKILSKSGGEIGAVTSGGFGPSVPGPVAMGYVAADQAEIGNRVDLLIRGKAHEGKIVEMPFVPHRYHRG